MALVLPCSRHVCLTQSGSASEPSNIMYHPSIHLFIHPTFNLSIYPSIENLKVISECHINMFVIDYAIIIHMLLYDGIGVGHDANVC